MPKLGRLARLEKHSGISIDELLEKLDDTGGELAIIIDKAWDIEALFDANELRMFRDKKSLYGQGQFDMAMIIYREGFKKVIWQGSK